MTNEQMDREEQLTNLRNSNLITDDTYLSQLGIGNYSAALAEEICNLFGL